MKAKRSAEEIAMGYLAASFPCDEVSPDSSLKKLPWVRSSFDMLEFRMQLEDGLSRSTTESSLDAPCPWPVKFLFWTVAPEFGAVGEWLREVRRRCDRWEAFRK